MADNLIKPHGSDTLNPLYVADDAKRAELEKEAATLPSIVVCSQAAANAVMMASGYFNPLTGFMSLEETLSVADKMQLKNGLFWPTPVVNVVEDASAIKGAKRIALKDPNVDGNPVIAIQDVVAIEEATDEQMKHIAEKVYATTDEKHPGVAERPSSVPRLGQFRQRAGCSRCRHPLPPSGPCVSRVFPRPHGHR